MIPTSKLCSVLFVGVVIMAAIGSVDSQFTSCMGNLGKRLVEKKKVKNLRPGLVDLSRRMVYMYQGRTPRRRLDVFTRTPHIKNMKLRLQRKRKQNKGYLNTPDNQRVGC